MSPTFGLSKAQRDLRRTGIGSSEIGVLAGLSPYGSPMEVWAAKVHGLEKDETLAMTLGTLTEEPIARLYAKRTGLYLGRVGTIQCAAKPFIIATPDRSAHGLKPRRARAGLEEVDHFLEVKHTTMQLRQRWGPEGTDQVPAEHLAQVTWQMRATGPTAESPQVRRTDVAALFDKKEFAVFTVTYSVELALGLEEVGERFMVDHVLAKVPPPPDASAQYKETLTRIFPAETGGLKPAPMELEEAALVLRELKHHHKALGERVELIENALRLCIGDGKGVQGRFGSVTWTKNRDGSATDWRAVAEAMRELWRGSIGDAAAKEFLRLVAEKTAPTPGARVLRKNWNKELPPPAGSPPASCALELELS